MKKIALFALFIGSFILAFTYASNANAAECTTSDANGTACGGGIRIGTNLVGANPSSDPITLTTQNVINYCSSYTSGGFGGWRMPTASELNTVESMIGLSGKCAAAAAYGSRYQFYFYTGGNYPASCGGTSVYLNMRNLSGENYLNNCMGPGWDGGCVRCVRDMTPVAPVTIPTAPSSLNGYAQSSTQNYIYWTDNSSNETGFYVYRNGSYIGSTTSASYTNTGLSCGTQYSYYVIAYNGAGNSSASNTAYVTTSACPAPSTAPTWSTLIASDGYTIASWSSVANATAYRVYRNGSLVADTSSTTFIDYGTSRGSAYTYYVVAYNGTGTSPSSTSYSITAISLPSLSGAAASQTQINLSWTNASPGTVRQTAVYRGGSNIYTSPTDAAPTSYSVTGLTCGTSYSFYVSHPNFLTYNPLTGLTNSQISIGASNTVTVSTSACLTAPTAPSSASASAASGSQINLSWTDNSSNEDGFYIYRNGSYLTSVSANTTSYASTGLSCGTSYSYYVIAYNGGGNSSASNTTSASTSICPPTAPSGLSGTAASTSQINLSWTDNSSNESGFNVYRNGSYIGGGTGTSFPDTGLSCGTTYSYYVAAYNAGGSNNSSTINASTSACPVLPSQASFSQIGWDSCGSGSACIGISNNATANATGYYLYRNGSLIYTSNSSGQFVIDDTGLAFNTTYTYYIVPFNGNGTGPASTSYNITTIQSNSSLSGSAASTSQINLSWSKAGSNSVTNMIIYRNGSQIYNAGGSTSMTSYSDTGLSCGTAYSYQVLYYLYAAPVVGSVYQNGQQYTNTINVTTSACPVAPNAPTMSYLYSGSNYDSNVGTMNVGWNSVSGATGYRVYRDGSLLSDTTNTSIIDSSVYAGTTYSYYVVAYNGVGTSSASTTYSTKALNRNSSLSGSAGSQSQINLSWSNTNSSLTSEVVVYRGGSMIYGYSAKTSHSDTGLSCGVSYTYQVQYNHLTPNPVTGGSATVSAYTNSITVSTDTCTPGTPTGVSATATGPTTATVTYTAGSPNTATSYTAVSSPGNNSGSTSGTTASLSGLTCNTSYQFYVYAIANSNGRTYQSGNSSYSNSITTGACPDTTPPTPNPPTVTAVPTSQTTIQVSMSAGSDNVALHSTPYGYSTDGGSSYSWYSTNGATQLSGLSCGTTYSVYGKIRDAAGNMTSASTPPTVTTIPCNPVMTDLGEDTNSVAIKWNAATGATGYYVYRNGSIIANVSSASPVYDTSVSGGTTYTYIVRAYNGWGDAGSASYNITTMPANSTLSASAASATSINLSWSNTNASNSVVNLMIYRNGSQIYNANGASSLTSYTDSGLTCGTSYSYYVEYVYSKTPALGSIWSTPHRYTNTVSVTTSGCAPSTAPTMNSIGPEGTGIYMYWNAPSDATSVQVYRNGSYLSSPGGSLWDQGLSANTTYTYKLRACNASGCGPFTQDYSVTTFQTISAYVNATTQTSVQICWTDPNTSNAQQTYGHFLKDVNGVRADVLAASGTCATDTSVSCGTTYNYYVRGSYLWTTQGTYTSANTTKDSANISATTASCVTPPTAPSNFKALNYGSYTYFSWSDNSSDENGFKIYRNGSLFTTLSANTTSYYDWSTPTSKYTYYVVAYKDPGAVPSSQSNSYTAAGPITTVSATALSSTSIRVNWTEINSEQSSMTLYASVNGSWNYISSTPSSGSQTATVTAPCGTTNIPVQMVAYYYDASGNSQGWIYGSTAYATISSPVQCPPTAASGLSATTVSKTQLNLSWTDNSSDESGFYIYRNGSYITAVGANTTSYNDTGVACGTAYNYYVVAYNGGGNAGASNTASGTTSSCVVAPNTVTGVNAQQIPGVSQINLSYSGTGSGYFVVRALNGTNEAVFDLGSSTSTSLSNLRCPGDYTIRIFAYNSDTSLGSVDPGNSCSIPQALGANVTNKLCSPVTSTIKLIRHCTQGFLTD